METADPAVAEALAARGVPLDVVLRDPHAQAPWLYRLARLTEQAPPRITIPGLPGVAKAASVALALNLPVRVLPGQPSPEILAELAIVLDRYLHDSQAAQPVEPFHSGLVRLTWGDPAGLWEILEEDPILFPRDDRPSRTRSREGECATCPLVDWCEGYFKWPDPSYSCTGVRELMGRLETAAVQLRADLEEVP